MGLSGCGKSTLLRCINRLIEPTAGKLYIDGEDVLSMNESQLRDLRRKKVGMIFQKFALLPHRTIMDNVAFGLEIQGVPAFQRREKAREAIKLVGLDGYENSKPSELSGGMQQRVGLARALASDVDILLMDEAFSALDPLIRRNMQDELLELQDRVDKTIIFVSHDLDEALKLGDRIALMKDGEIVQVGTAEEILTRPSTKYVEKFVENVDMSRVLSARDVMKAPGPLLAIDSGPTNALRIMNEHDATSVFVVSKHRQFRGVIEIDQAMKAKLENRTIQDILISDVPVVSPETPLSEVIPQIADAKYPIPVVDDTGKIKGVIRRGCVLAGLARIEVNSP